MTGQVVEREPVPGERRPVPDQAPGRQPRPVRRRLPVGRRVPHQRARLPSGRGGDRADRVGAPDRHREGGPGGRPTGHRGRPGRGDRADPPARRRRPRPPGVRRIETGDIGTINHAQEQIRLKLRRLELRGITAGPEVSALQAERPAPGPVHRAGGATGRVVEGPDRGRGGDHRRRQGEGAAALPGGRRLLPNAMGLPGQDRATTRRSSGSFVSDDPREANTEGGVFPAIFGTVMMVSS